MCTNTETLKEQILDKACLFCILLKHFLVGTIQDKDFDT